VFPRLPASVTLLETVVVADAKRMLASTGRAKAIQSTRHHQTCAVQNEVNGAKIDPSTTENATTSTQSTGIYAGSFWRGRKLP